MDAAKGFPMPSDYHEVGSNEAAGTQRHVIDAWPRCPECGAPRVTCCPVCQTAGHDFPQVDPEFAVAPDAEAVEEPMSCGCGSGCGGCGADRPGSDASHVGDVADNLTDDAVGLNAPTMLTCTTCDEPFVPQYLKCCEWCGHVFPDGFEFELPTDPAEPLNARILFVFFTLAGGALALLGWLAYVM